MHFPRIKKGFVLVLFAFLVGLFCLRNLTISQLGITNVAPKHSCINEYRYETPEVNSTEDVRQPVENMTMLVEKLDVEIKRHHSLDSYFIPRKTKINPQNYTFILDGRQICKNETPYILVFVPSVHDHAIQRQRIRKTWGSVVRTGQWADGTHLPRIKLMFLFGIRDKADMYTTLEKENVQYGDIVLGDFKDSYRNLTTKTLMALYWMIKYCPHAEFLLKNDEDTAVHLPRLLRALEKHPSNTIIGRKGNQLQVTRKGRIEKWIVTKEEYPLDYYPPYILGNFYVIPNDLVSKLYHLSEYIPYLSMEDVFVTGILRLIWGGDLFDPSPNDCMYFCALNDTVAVGFVVSHERLEEIWDVFSKRNSSKLLE